MSRGGSPAGGKGARGRDVEERASFASRAWEQIWPLAAAVLVALGIRAVIIESYYVPSGSMFPSLLIGDHVSEARKVLSSGSAANPEDAMLATLLSIAKN